MSNHSEENTSRRRCGVLGLLCHLVLVYVLLVFGGGTLINTGHPVAVEVGRIFQIVTFVEPSIYWAESSGHNVVAEGLRHLADGVDLGRLT